jgi:DNA polymerase-3 subunit alpha
MSNYVPIQVKTHYSLLRALNRPATLLEHAKKSEFKSLAITDYGTISGCVNFFKTFKGSGIKPILGVTLYICEKDSTNHNPSNQYYSYLTIIAKNLAGWKELIKIVSFSNDPSRFCMITEKPRLSIDDLRTFNLKNLICVTGGVGSTTAKRLFSNTKIAYNGDPYSTIDPIGIQECINHLRELESMFGQDSVFLECSNSDAPSTLLTSIWTDNPLPYKRIISTDSHYIEPQDAFDQRVLLCSNFGCKMHEVNSKAPDMEEYTYGRFFISNKYGLPPNIDTKDELLKNTYLLSDMCEEYNILNKPSLPIFDCPNGLNVDEYLRQLCREGWQKRIVPRVKKEDQVIYSDRIKRELEVLQGAGLSTYFLMLNDIVSWVQNQGWLVGPARGSAGGCLTAYLSNITAIDPIKHDLIFERFYNAGRNTADHVAMPDIDIDVPSESREKVIEYITNKYGQNRVAQMMTYGTLKGRQAITEVLDVYGSVSFDVIKQITEPIPDEAKIADGLQEMKEEEGESSIIKWTLENEADKLREWCWIAEDKTLDGPLAKRFEQAIRLEGIKKAQSKHASGVVVSSIPLTEICPLIYDKKEGGMLTGVEMGDVEALGIVKADILATRVLDKIQTTQELLLNT